MDHEWESRRESAAAPESSRPAIGWKAAPRLRNIRSARFARRCRSNLQCAPAFAGCCSTVAGDCAAKFRACAAAPLAGARSLRGASAADVESVKRRGTFTRFAAIPFPSSRVALRVADSVRAPVSPKRSNCVVITRGNSKCNEGSAQARSGIASAPQSTTFQTVRRKATFFTRITLSKIRPRPRTQPNAKPLRPRRPGTHW